jgi:phage tail-like protein
MAGRDHDGDFQGSFFSLIVDGLTLGYFTKCSGISIEFDVINFKEGDGTKVIARKRAGKPSYSEIQMSRGFTQNDTLYKWFKSVVDAKDATPYKTGSIVVHDRQAKPVAKFNLLACWPSNLKVSDLTAGSDEVMIEDVTMQHEGLDWA